MPTPLDHPAVAVAAGLAASAGTPMSPAAVHVRDEFAAVVMTGEVADFGPVRCTVAVHRVGDRWTGWGRPVLGAAFTTIARPERTVDHLPLRNLARDWLGCDRQPGWFALTGIAAADVVSVTVKSTLEESTVAPAADGLVLAVVAARPDGERPSARIRTRDGRTLPVAP